MEELIGLDGDIVHPYKSFITKTRYSRWIEEADRRETWTETVDRYINYMTSHLRKKHNYTPPKKTIDEVKEYILNHMSLPSMRALMTAGPALERNNVAAYNCSYIVIDDPVAFDETLYILMNGTGVGFSAEAQYVNKLPDVPRLCESDEVIVVDDSKEGWGYAYRELITGLYSGRIPKWDVSGVREEGARLKTFGGRASGPAPLVDLFEFTITKFMKAQGRKLRPIEVHDIICKVASVVVVGGVRRSALISLGDLSDQEMATAKSGTWWEEDSQRALANLSAVYDGKPSREIFDVEWKNLVSSGSGERGIFNREASRRVAGLSGRRDTNWTFGTNPCSEIVLRPNQFCNLSTIVVREDDTQDSLEGKARVASILGTWQSTLTDFKYLRPVWRENTEEERLLGVSMTGPLGNNLLNFTGDKEATRKLLRHLKDVVVSTNASLSKEIGIPQSTATTCIKPEGTTSQKTLTPSGLHTWHDSYYLRSVRGSKTDPVTRLLTDSNFYVEDDLMNPDKTSVFYFPIAAPEGAMTRSDISAIEHLEIWREYQREWCEHKPSVTISVRAEEWAEVGDWVYANFEDISGVSFLPYSDHTYQQAPYQSLTREEYEQWLAKTPSTINWELLPAYEIEDTTSATQELSCVAGACDIVDITK